MAFDRNFLAVTIGVGPVWRVMAELAAESVRRRTGLETRILGEEAMVRCRVRSPHFLKMRLFEEFPEAEHILYSDADTIFLQQWDPRVFAGRGEFICVRERADDGNVQREAQLAALPADMYFHAGLFLVNRTHHAAMLHKAEHDIPEFETHFFERTYLNRARRILGIPALFLPKEYNFLDFDRHADSPRTVVGHFHHLGQRPPAEIGPYFRSWLELTEGRRAPDPRLAGYVSRPPGDADPPVPPERAHYRALLEAAVENPAPWPAGRFAGRGIVICGGGSKYFPCVWVCVRMLRHLGCTLPIELWHLGPHEVTPTMRALIEPFGVRCVDGLEVRQRHPVRTLHGWEMKCYALLHCAFAEVLLLDADNVPVVDPAFLFHGPEYYRTGAVFWPDFGRLGPERSIWPITGIPYRDEPEFESGQIVVDKARSWAALQLAMHFNEHSDFYYRHVHGDKETFHLAWRKLAQDYAMPERPIHALEATMCQHDFQGRRIFQHRNFDKWRVLGDHRRIHGFQHEAQCLAFLDDLRDHWQELPRGVRRWRPEQKTPAERAAAANLCARPWLYCRIGHDERALTFHPSGLIGEGANDRERLWDLRAVGDRIFVEIFAHHEKTLAAEWSHDGIWRGRWVAYEQMPVELLPGIAGEEFPSNPTAGTWNNPLPAPRILNLSVNNSKQPSITNS